MAETPPNALIPIAPAALDHAPLGTLPRLIVAAGPHASRRFLEFFVATIRKWSPPDFAPLRGVIDPLRRRGQNVQWALNISL